MTNEIDTPPVLRTARLVLRPPEESDIAAWFARATDRQSAYLAGDPVPEDVTEGIGWLARTRANARAGVRLLWSIDIREGESSVGTVGLSLKKPGISFVIGRPFWRRGIATEAAREVLRFGRDEIGLREVRSEFVTENTGSRRVHAKLGFRHVGNFVDDTDGAACERHVLYL